MNTSDKHKFKKLTMDEQIKIISEKDSDKIYEERVSNQLFSRIMVAEFCAVYFAIVGLCLCITIHEFKHNRNNGHEELTIQSTDIYNSICTVCLLISIYIKYDLQLQWLVSVQ
jgi:hypothetical protein